MARTRRPLSRALPVLAVAAVAAGCTAGCATNPATGERELSLIGERQEIEMGREADQQIVASLGVYDDPELQAYVDRIGQELAAASERPDLPWTFRVLDDPTVNAFALPGGFIYITRGILSHLTSEAELAGILGHEIGHVTARHSVNQISKAQLTQLGVGIGMVLVPELRDFGGLANVGMQLLFLKHGRDDENQADALGVRYMTRLDYDPRELADVMAMLERSSEMQQGSGRIPEWLSTHPDPANRIEHIGEITARLQADLSPFLVRRDPYMDRIDGMVFGMDPREGYFEENTFYHPELRFRIAFPRGWQTANMKQAVQAVAGSEDAVMGLTFAQGSPSEAMRQFAAQQGVRVSGVQEVSLNGLPATVGELTASTEQGTLEGAVAFVSYDGDTYRLLGYGTPAGWRSHAASVREAIRSFAPENDPAVLSVEPARLSLVALDQSLPFSAFADRYPSTVRPELVALINQVRVDGSLEAGMRAKRVVGGR